MTGTDPQAYCPGGPWRCGITAGRMGTGQFGTFTLYDVGSGYSTTQAAPENPAVAQFESEDWDTVGWSGGSSTFSPSWLLPAGVPPHVLCNGGLIPNDPVCYWHWSDLGQWTFDGITGAAIAPLNGGVSFTTEAGVIRWNGTDHVLQDAFDLDPFTPGHTEYGVSWGTSSGWTWGERLMALWAWMPTMGRGELTGLIEERAGSGGAIIDSFRYFDGDTLAEDYHWDSGQWPWWPTYLRQTPNNLTPSPSPFVQPAYPVWITCSHARPPVVPAGDYENGFTSGTSNTGTILAEASVWWWSDGLRDHYRPMLLAGNWWESSTFTDWSNAGAYYFMGCPNWFPFQTQGAYPKADENGDEVDEWTPEDWVEGFPENVSFPDRFRAYEYDWGLGGASSRGSAMADLSYPSLKIDGAMRVPGFEFRIPAALQALIDEHGAENLTVVASTASVTVTDPLRREYKYESARPAINYRLRLLNNAPWPWGLDDDWRMTNLSDVLVTGEWYGVKFWQLSDDGTGTETWKEQFKVTHTATGARYAPIDSDNTHVHQSEWQDDVVAATTDEPNVTRAPRWIPKRNPWYPTDSANGPEDVENDPESVKLAHALVGLQWWGAETGAGGSDHKVRQPLALMKRLAGLIDGDDYATTPSGLLPASTGSWPSPPLLPSTLVEGAEQAHRDQDFLEYWQGELELDGPIDGLDNCRLRYLGIAHVDPQEDYEDEDNRLYDATPRTVNMVELVEALLASEALRGTTKTDAAGGTYAYQHHAYRVLPCLPHDPATAPSTVDGVVTSVAPLFATNLPRVCDLVAEGSVTSGRMVSKIGEIVFQRFATWQMTDWTITVEDPTTAQHTITIPTPWDEV